MIDTKMTITLTICLISDSYTTAHSKHSHKHTHTNYLILMWAEGCLLVRLWEYREIDYLGVEIIRGKKAGIG